MKLYVIRHGQTKCNVENKYNCRLDEDINEVGIKQAEQVQYNFILKKCQKMECY